MNTYIFLGGAIVAEVIGTIFYEIFRRIYTPVAVCRNCNKLLRCLLSAFPNIGKYTFTGIAYAIWSGAGIVLISLAGWLVSGQKLDWPAIAGMFLICVEFWLLIFFQNLLRINFYRRYWPKQKDFLEILSFSARNLFPVNKNHRYQRWFVCRNSELPTFCSDGNWLSRSADT